MRHRLPLPGRYETRLLGSAELGLAGATLASLFLVACSSAPAPRAPDPQATAPMSDAGKREPLSRARVFFSGHSLLDNPLPDFIESIASAQGQDLRWNQQNVTGSSLRVRTNGGHGRTWASDRWKGYLQGKNREGSGMDVLRELRSPQTIGPGERYDTLVITERHDIPYTLVFEDTVGYLRHFHDRLVEGNPLGRTYFYHTWQSLDKAAPLEWIAYEKAAVAAWECAASKVNLTLQAEGRGERVLSLPGSLALVDLIERILAGQVRGITGTPTQKLDAIFPDNVHLTPLGAYFMGAVQYAAIFGQSPVGAPGPEGARA
ncbi:MAG: hypothetical protein L0Y64_01470, partial [Myxococcaceae bacterium]|nr:hypothetical protein [Myxococcaceae bacterium]